MSGSSPALALVTGTTSGIGLAVAEALLDRGWEVVGPLCAHEAIDPAGEHWCPESIDATSGAVPVRANSYWERDGCPTSPSDTGW